MARRRKQTGPLTALFVFTALAFSGVHAALSGADIRGDTDGYFFLTDSGCTCCATVTVTTSGGGSFTIEKDGTTLVSDTVTAPSSDITLPCTAFGNAPGMYTVTMTVSQGGNSHAETMVAVYEETLVGYTVSASQLIAPPYTEITFNMEVSQGTNALFTVDCVTNIQLMKSCDGNTRTATYSQMFNDTGSHVITTMVSNYGSKLSEVVVVTIIHNMNNVAITIGNNKPQTTEDPNIKVTMAGGAQLPMGNLTGWHTCTSNGSPEVVDLSGLTPGGEVPIPCVCSTQTNKTVTVNVSTELSTIQETYDIYCWDMLNITVTLDKDVQPINDVIPFIIENVPNYGIQWNIDACQNIMITNTDSSNYASPYTTNPVDLSSIIYTETGNCTFHATFWNEMYIVVLDLTFELSIGVNDLTAEPSALEILTGDTFTVTVNATGLDIFWAVDFTEAMVVQNGCSGLVAEHNFSSAGVYTIEVMASNRVNNKSTSFELSVAYPINGYTVTLTAPTIQSHENLEINAALSASPNVPMGNLTITISPCGDTDSSQYLPVTAGSTEKYNCNFTKQGNYTIGVTIASLVSSENYTVEAFVCDNLAITIDVDKTDWAVGDTVTVNMNTLPLSGFKYRVDMGDGSTIHSNEADSVLDGLNTFTTIPSQAYNAPGTYTINLYAYNHCYSVTSSVTIAVEYGIPPCNLVVAPTRKLITPDDTTTFSFVTQSGSPANNPTNVTCTWNLGDGTPVTDQLTNMDFVSGATGYVIRHDYTTAEGSVNYQIDCQNRVSNVSFSGTVDVVIVRAADFSVNFEVVTPLPEGTCTSFDITLNFHNISTVPNNVTYTVDYDDGSGVSSETALSSYVVSKSLCKRGAYPGGVLTVFYDGVSKANPISYFLGTCSLKLIGSTVMGLVGTDSFSFTLTNHLATEQITVQIDWKDGNTEDKTLTGGQSMTVTHTFATHGFKKPSYTATTSLGNDGASLEEELYLMYPVDNLELEIPVPVLLGVTLEPNIIYSGSNSLINITCNVTYDATTNELMTGVDLTPSSSSATAVGNMYMVIQEETITVVCSNPLTSKTLNATFEVSSDCFLAPDIFESIHRRIETPMRVYRSSLPTLTARVKLADKCKNTTEFNFQWTFQKQNPVTLEFEPYTTIETPNRISMNLATTSIEEGFYLVQLYMKLVERENDYLQDKQYMKIVNPPLVCSIVGGDFIKLGKGETLVLNAKTNSYDPLNGIKQDSGLDFSWACYRIDDCEEVESYTLPKSTDKSYRNKSDCGLTFQTEGYIEVDTTPLDAGKCYVFEQTISKDSRNASAIQVVNVTAVAPCKIAMMCVQNCMEKVTPEEPTTFEVNIICGNATKEQLDAATYRWTLAQFDFSTNQFNDISWDSNFKTLPTVSVFELKRDYFTAGASYRLQITAEAAGRPENIAYKTLVANEKPRGGTCEFSPLQGVFLNTTFSVVCNNWMDEGIRNEKDDTVDIQEPLKFKLVQDGSLISTTDFTRKVSHAAVDLKVGSEANNFDTVVEMIIYDAFGGETVFNVTVKVENSMPPVPAFGTAAANLSPEEQERQQAKYSNYLTDAKNTVSNSEGNGAPLDTAVIISSLAQAINTAEFPTVSTYDVTHVTSENADAELSRTLEAGTQVNPMLEKIQGVNEVFVNSLKEGIENELQLLENSSKTPSADTIITFASSMATVVANPALLTGDAIGGAGDALEMLSSVMGSVANSTLSTVAVEKMQHAVGSLLSNVIHCNNYFAVTGVEVEGSDQFENNTNKDDGYNEVEADYLKKLLKNKRKLQLKQATDRINANIKSILKAVENMYKLSSGLTITHSSSAVEEKTFIQSIEKDKANNIINDTKVVNGSALEVASLDGVEPEDDVQKNMVVLHENPFTTGVNAKMAEYPVTMASMTKNGKKLQLKGAVISQTDPVEAPYVFYSNPEFTPGDPGYMLYHPFPYRASSEQICIVSKPVNVSVCYDVYLRALIPPTEFEYDQRDLNVTGNVGLEYCAEAGSCKRTGTCWLGIVPFPCEGNGNGQAHHRARRAASVNNTGVPGTSSITEQGGDANSSDPLLTPYNLRIVTLSCLSWDGGEQDWDASVCKVKRDPVNNKTMCMCGDREDVITTVSFFVAPNKIDFSTVFSKFDIAGQGAVLGTILVIFVLFVVFLFWGRYMDGQDVLQWGVTLLADNYKGDSYYYLVTIHTGMVRHGGTRSKIGFCIAGEDEDTGVRMLSDGVREELKAGSTMHFLMAVPECLGTLQCFRVWHDNSGKGNSASWYLNRVEVTDLQTADKYDFLCYQWMSLEEGTLDKALALSSTENMKNFKTMFFEHARHHLTDDHLWVSVLLRPVKSHFSRVQRVGCCYTLLMLAMIANAMFFQSKDNKDRQQTSDFTIGPIRFSLSQIYISFISTILTTIPVFFIMLLFRKSKLSEKATKDGTRMWMPYCFRKFKFYKQSKAIEKIMVIRDIVDDQDGVLPHFCVYISWVFAFICVFLSAFFIMLYSMEWGKDISEEWLLTFILSFFESLIIMDPVKVLVLAVLFAILLKTLKASKPSHFDLNHIGRMNRENGQHGEGRARLDYRSPFSEEELQRAKTQCRRRNTMRKAIQELLANSFFLWLLASISYSNRDPHGYLLHKNIKNTFMEPFKPAVTLKHVNTSAHYFRWLNETVIPNLFPVSNFNGSRLSPNMRLRIGDLSNYRVGAPRLRQVRQAEKSCTIPFVGKTKCYPQYDLATEENRNWCSRWKHMYQDKCPDKESLAVTNAAWTFVSALKIWGLPITGERAVYGGGGYIAELDINRQVAEMAFNELYEARWVDRNTRGVFLEFTLYNANKNIFCYVSILVEFPESGGVVEFTNVFPFRSFNHIGTVGKYILFCEIVFFIFTILWLGYITFKLMKERWCFFKSFWNVVELTSVVISFIAVILYFVRLTYTNEAMALFKENDRVFINFYHIAVWDNLFVYAIAFLLGIATLRLLRVMGYSRVTQIVYLVLKESSKTLPGFFFYILLILSAYGFLGYLVFGSNALAYKDVVTTMETLFSAVLGHAGFRKTNAPVGDSWISLIYFVTFILIVVFALSNMFMTILLDTMSLVGDDPKNLNYKEIELFAYMWESAKTLITGKKEPSGLDATKRGSGLDDKDTDESYTFENFGFGDAHDRKMQMKIDLAAAFNVSAKPAYKY